MDKPFSGCRRPTLLDSLRILRGPFLQVHRYKIRSSLLEPPAKPRNAGEFLYEDLIPSDLNLPDSVLSLEGEDKTLFLDFVGQMLQWLPEKRKSADDLLKHPWLAA